MTDNLKEYMIGIQRSKKAHHWLDQTIMLWPMSLNRGEKIFLRELLEAAEMYWPVINAAIDDVEKCQYITEGHHKPFITSILTLP